MDWDVTGPAWAHSAKAPAARTGMKNANTRTNRFATITTFERQIYVVTLLLRTVRQRATPGPSRGSSAESQPAGLTGLGRGELALQDEQGDVVWG
jgi:hypothetical protein